MHGKSSERKILSCLFWFIIVIFVMSFLIHWTVKGIRYEVNNHSAGKTFTEENEEYVYCSASAAIYATRDSSQPIGMLIDVVNYFTDTSVAELIDSNKFPIPISYKAFAHEEKRYQIEYGGNTYWIDPCPSLPVTDSTPSP